MNQSSAAAAAAAINQQPAGVTSSLPRPPPHLDGSNATPTSTNTPMELGSCLPSPGITAPNVPRPPTTAGTLHLPTATPPTIPPYFDPQFQASLGSIQSQIPPQHPHHNSSMFPMPPLIQNASNGVHALLNDNFASNPIPSLTAGGASVVNRVSVSTASPLASPANCKCGSRQSVS